MPVFIQIAMLAALAGSFLVYASARHQRIKDGAPTRLGRWIGWALLATVLPLLLCWFGIASAIFSWLTLMMLVWTIIPLGFAWWDWRRKGYP